MPPRIQLLLLPQTLLVSISRPTESTVPDVVYRVSKSSRCYHRLSRYPLEGTLIPQDVIRSMHRDALQKAGVEIEYPQLAKYHSTIHACSFGEQDGSLSFEEN